MDRKFQGASALAIIMCFWTAPAGAGGFDPTSFATATNAMLSDIGAMVALGADLHMYEGAKPVASLKGADAGTSLTFIQLSGKVVNALTTLGSRFSKTLSA